MSLYGPENNTPINILNDGESVYFKDGKIQKGVNEEYGYPYAKADTFIVGKNGPKLSAWGGGCRVVALYEGKSRIGAILHIDAADIWSGRHEELMDKLFTTFPILANSATQSYILGDVEEDSTFGEKQTQWNNQIDEFLENKKTQVVTTIAVGMGKDVLLDTKSGQITVRDDNKVLLFQTEGSKT